MKPKKQQSQPASPRKLRVPGKLVILPPPPVTASAEPPPPPPPCVKPRRRFIKWFLAITGLITLLGNVIFYYGCEAASPEPEMNIFLWIAGLFMFLGTLGMFEAPVFALLTIPVRTSRGSLLQLIGLALPLLVAVFAFLCSLGDIDPSTAWGYGAFISLLCGGGILYFYLPGYLLHLGITLISKHRNRS